MKALILFSLFAVLSPLSHANDQCELTQALVKARYKNVSTILTEEELYICKYELEVLDLQSTHPRLGCLIDKKDIEAKTFVEHHVGANITCEELGVENNQVGILSLSGERGDIQVDSRQSVDTLDLY